MESLYGEFEDYYEKCGEIFITVQGNITFHCTLCENRFKNFEEYNEHILVVHYAPDYNEELDTDSIKEEEDSFDPLSEENYSFGAEDLIVKEEEIETNMLRDDIEQAANERYVKELDEEPTPAIAQSNNSSENKMIRKQLLCINVKPTITNRKYKCPHCGFAGADKSNMDNHIKRHSMYRPHKCTECTKTFYTRTELKAHIRSHTGERPFLCTHCGHAFRTSSEFGNHQKIHSGIRDKECPICKMRFYDQKRLSKHMVRHSDKRNYKCDQCDATFKTCTALRTHRKLHENKREYQCKLCDARFNQNAGLYSHMKSSHTVVFNSSKVPTKK